MLVDKMGRFLTQSLFLETNYGPDAIYTLKDVDFEYNGRIYPSIKRLYLEVGDPTEYRFACTYFAGIKQWNRIASNKLFKGYVEEWRYELELKLRSEGIKLSMQQARKGSWQASKWLADKGWDDKKVGRPSKEDIDRERKLIADIGREFDMDANRLLQ